MSNIEPDQEIRPQHGRNSKKIMVIRKEIKKRERLSLKTNDIRASKAKSAQEIKIIWETRLHVMNKKYLRGFTIAM